LGGLRGMFVQAPLFTSNIMKAGAASKTASTVILYFGKTAMSMTMMGVIMAGSILQLTGTFVAFNMF
jgi:hypothetical protein